MTAFSLDAEKSFTVLTLRTFYFNDFFLDDILLVNTFGRLENFLLSEVSMTLISALRMISNRPKLRSLGQLLQWDVEVCELEVNKHE